MEGTNEDNKPTTTAAEGPTGTNSREHGEQDATAQPEQRNPKDKGKKRKHHENARLQQGARNKRRDMGRMEYFRNQPDRRARNEREQEKRRKLEEEGKGSSILPVPFSQEEVAQEQRRPKRKVAVMIGYSGSGYKGMQISHTEKTIEGDLFTAFVKAGAISKANADDPKKSALVRCARTDKGVHAAGNVISLKMIIEDEDIVEKINSHLTPQIRVWGIQRATGSFSCYQACDSRCYLGRKLVEYADKCQEREAYEERQAEVAKFWPETEEKYIKPILDTLDEPVRKKVEEALYHTDDHEGPQEPAGPTTAAGEGDQPLKVIQPHGTGDAAPSEKTEEAVILLDMQQPATETEHPGVEETKPQSGSGLSREQKAALEAAMKSLRAAYVTAKKAYRISDRRVERLKEVLELYCGTRNYHNYTIQKKFRDPSAKRHIKSFKVGEKPIIINDTEWLSLKVHGQSFMMHQIRKMVGMATLVVRCGCNPNRILESFRDVNLSIPKAPGLGLLLERPVFDNYNEKAADKFQREKIDFSRYEKEMEEFKEREIYQRIFREEAEGNIFHSFFSHIDNNKEPWFLFLTSGGIDAVNEGLKERKGALKQPTEVESEDEASAGEG